MRARAPCRVDVKARACIKCSGLPIELAWLISAFLTMARCPPDLSQLYLPALSCEAAFA